MKMMSFGCYLCPLSLTQTVSPYTNSFPFCHSEVSMYDYKSARGEQVITVSVTLLIDDHLLHCIGLRGRARR